MSSRSSTVKHTCPDPDPTCGALVSHFAAFASLARIPTLHQRGGGSTLPGANWRNGVGAAVTSPVGPKRYTDRAAPYAPRSITCHSANRTRTGLNRALRLPRSRKCYLYAAQHLKPRLASV